MNRCRRAWPHLLAGLMLVLAWDASGLDLPLAHAFGDAGGFAARDAFWARGLLHEGLRGLWVLVWLLLAVDALRAKPAAAGPARGERRLALALGVFLLLLGPLLKSLSQSSCPWSLRDFGGDALWVSHWNWRLRDGGPGHCFPSGHTLGAFAFAPFAWIWQRRGVWALLFLSGALASLGQLARGAHFLSHSLWAAWIALSAACLMLQILNGFSARKAFTPLPKVNRLGD